MAFLNNNRAQGALALFLVIIFAAAGVYFGIPPESATAGSFGATLRAFALEQQTRTIIAAILVDVVTGVIAALRLGVFDTARLAQFMRSNVLPYLLGYMLFWFLAFYGLIDLLPVVMTNGIASLGYGAVMASLTVSILDNLKRASAGSTPPADAISGNLPPYDPQA